MGNNFEKVDSMASHSGYSTKDGSIVQLQIENSGLATGDAGTKRGGREMRLGVMDRVGGVGG